MTAEEPRLRVVRGDPTDDELAALVAVVTVIGASKVDDERTTRSEWSAPHRRLRAPLPPGWRSGALPR